VLRRLSHEWGAFKACCAIMTSAIARRMILTYCPSEHTAASVAGEAADGRSFGAAT
jgi:hypothetical protein